MVVLGGCWNAGAARRDACKGAISLAGVDGSGSLVAQGT